MQAPVAAAGARCRDNRAYQTAWRRCLLPLCCLLASNRPPLASHLSTQALRQRQVMMQGLGAEVRPVPHPRPALPLLRSIGRSCGTTCTVYKPATCLSCPAAPLPAAAS